MNLARDVGATLATFGPRRLRPQMRYATALVTQQGHTHPFVGEKPPTQSRPICLPVDFRRPVGWRADGGHPDSIRAASSPANSPGCLIAAAHQLSPTDRSAIISANDNCRRRRVHFSNSCLSSGTNLGSTLRHPRKANHHNGLQNLFAFAGRKPRDNCLRKQPSSESMVAIV